MGLLSGHPSTVVVCGNSEVEQQVGMLGLDPAVARSSFYADELRREARAAGLDALVIPSTPTGGDQPFRTGSGVTHYYGVGAYLRPLSDMRVGPVRFAAECLAFANVPNGSAALAEASKSGIPRDAGASWDFEDVRDHYLAAWYAVDPVMLRSADPRAISLCRERSAAR